MYAKWAKIVLRSISKNKKGGSKKQIVNILIGRRKFEIDILEIMKFIIKENIIKMKNKTQPDYEIEKLINETTLKGIFIKQLLEEKEKQNYTDEEINKILEIGLSIMDK